MTQQSCELLKVGEERLFMREGVYPLEDYFESGESPAKHWHLTALSTAENRGYAATWAIRDGSLYLVDIYTYRIVRKGFWFWRKTLYPELYVQDLFPEAMNGEVKATWFSGRISALTKTTVNPVNDRLQVMVKNGDVTEYQWYHLEGKSSFGGIPFDKKL